MGAPVNHEVTELLLAWSQGDQCALEKLTPLVYAELRRLAAHYMMAERPGHTLQATALVHECFLKLVEASRVRWQDRSHFFAVSAQLMRRILVDFARSRDYIKRGRTAPHVSLDEALIVAEERSADLVALDDALQKLAAVDPRKSRIVELRFFAGMSVDETAEILNVSPETVLRDWKLAKVWLFREISNE